jgi:hypothetical protein
MEWILINHRLDRRQLGHLMTAGFSILTTQGMPAATAFGRLTVSDRGDALR